MDDGCLSYGRNHVDSRCDRSVIYQYFDVATRRVRRIARDQLALTGTKGVMRRWHDGNIYISHAVPAISDSYFGEFRGTFDDHSSGSPVFG